jgi:ectoine hydroxylase-related dioxygenase (phytanoyl-CoA dioxygenase family)
MTTAEREQLDSVGYVILPGFMTGSVLQQLRTRTEQLFEEEGENAGWEFRKEAGSRRLANLVAKGEIYQRIVTMPEVLEYIESVLGSDYKLSSLNARSANPHSSETQQPLHADMGAIADELGYWVCNTVWMLDDFTEQNGALRCIPGSHRWRKLPQDELADLKAAHPDEILVTGAAGTVVVMNAHMWHGGTENRTGSHRRAVHGFYCRSDKPQQQYQKALIPAEMQAQFSADLRCVLALDDPRNDEVSSAMTNPSGFLR